MAHHRKAVGAAVALNTGIFVVEAVAGFQAQSLSLIMDSVHNLSDEMALVFVYLAFILSQGVSRSLLRPQANADRLGPAHSHVRLRFRKRARECGFRGCDPCERS
jgi:Cation efflux family